MLIGDLKVLFLNSISPRRRSYKVNEVVFRQGDAAHSIFAVEEGQIKLERYTPEGRGAIMHVAKSKECFAEAALFSDVYHCDAIATHRSQVIVFPKGEVLDALHKDPRMALRYIAMLSSQVRTLRAHLELRSILSARERILHYLLLNTPISTNTLLLPGTLKAWSAQLGLAHETVYRELKKLEYEGMIERCENSIIIKVKI